MQPRITPTFLAKALLGVHTRAIVYQDCSIRFWVTTFQDVSPHLLGVTHIPCSKISDFSRGHTWNTLFSGSLFSHQHLPAQPACAHCYLPPISRFHMVCKFYQLSVLFFFLPFANKGLLLCGYWIILQLFALRIFLPPTFSQLTFHRPCFYSFSLTSVGSVFIF